MNKVLFLTLCIISLIQAKAMEPKSIEATYDVSYSIFTLGKAKTSLKIFSNNTYSIKVHAYATGLAKVMSQNKEEFYESHGIVKNSMLIPHTFTKISQNDSKKRVKTYLFNHETNTVLLKRYDKKLHVTYNESLNPIKTWKETNSQAQNKFFASNDLLSLFFNIKQVIPNFDQGNNYKLKAIGANKTNGQLDISIPKGEKFETLKESLQTEDIKFIATINQKIFSSSNGELFISLNKSGFCNKAVLKDVLLFGDITGEMIEFNIKKG